MKQYRIRELTSPVNTFTPEYTEDGIIWNAISQSTCLTEAAAKQVIDNFVKKGLNPNEIIHAYQPGIKPLYD